MESVENYIKIPLLGLDNAGKTSLLHVLKREFAQLKMVTPTKGIERVNCKYFNKNIICWDFGGQKKYRENYFTKRDSEYFSDIKEWFYMVDVLDTARYEESIEYFQQLCKVIEKYSPNSTINLLINKLDPGSEKDDKKIELFTQLWEDFENLVISSNMKNIIVHQTSIKNPMSVIRAFSRPLFERLTIYDNFSLLFKDCQSHR